MSVLNRIILMIIVPILLILIGLIWYGLSSRFVTTDNAYVKSDITAISSNIDGRVVTIYLGDNQPVKKGQLLFELDERSYQTDIRKSEAKLMSIELRIKSLRSQHAQAVSRISDAQQNVVYRRKSFARQKDLFTKKLVSAANLDEAQNQLDQALQELQVIQEQAEQAIVELGGGVNLSAQKHPMYLEAAAELEEKKLLHTYTKIVSPAAGIVSRMTLKSGEWVEQGRPVFNIVGNKNLHIEANLKETQLTSVSIGQSVEIKVDAYPNRLLSGRVTHISAATGSEFTVLPAQNATGNWIKVVQRIPVIISLPEPTDEIVLRAGMTVRVSIDTGKETPILGQIRNLLQL